MLFEPSAKAEAVNFPLSDLHSVRGDKRSVYFLKERGRVWREGSRREGMMGRRERRRRGRGGGDGGMMGRGERERGGRGG